MVQVTATKNPAAPVELLERFSKHEELEVRQAAAENPSTPRRLVERAARDPDPWLKIFVGDLYT